MLKISSPNEYLVFTGLGITDMKILKKGWLLPWEKVSRIDLTPRNYTLSLNAMSAEVTNNLIKRKRIDEKIEIGIHVTSYFHHW
jgi:hypothetical protein